MKLTGNQIAFTIIAFIFGILVTIPLVIVMRAKPHAIEPKQVDLAPWKNLGAVSNGYYSATVMRRQDPDTNATIYVMIGGEHGGIFVLPAEKSK